jgi:hypothetical protein
MAISFHYSSPCGFNRRRLNQFSGALIGDEYYFRSARGDLFASTHKKAEQSIRCRARLDPSESLSPFSFCVPG